MAAKKIYAVKKGKVTGVFDSWEQCKASVEGYPGAEYKGFATLTEAESYLGQRAEEMPLEDLPESGCLLAYVDGSYEDSLKKYAFGCVFILADGRIFTQYGNGDNEQSLQHRNVTGEWRARTELTRKYMAAMREWSSDIEIKFTKVAAHTNVRYNELADQMAKTGLTEGQGVPKVLRIEEMTEWKKCD